MVPHTDRTIWCKHGICDNVTWHAKMAYMSFLSNARKASLKWSLKVALATTQVFALYNFFQSSSTLHKTRN